VRGRCYLHGFNGMPGSLPNFADAGVYEDLILKVNGEWRFASRSITLYVNGVTGSNAYDGQSANWDGTHGPKQSVDSAMASALDGDTIMIQAGTYQEGTLWTLGNRNIRLVPVGGVVIQ
jgi:hypothetical protein